MLDIKFVRENPELVKENIKKKFQDAKLPLVDEVLQLDAELRAAKSEAEALRDENGAPYFSFSGRAAALMQARGLTAHLSLTHEGGTAAAFVVLERREASASLKEEPECSTLR